MTLPTWVTRGKARSSILVYFLLGMHSLLPDKVMTCRNYVTIDILRRVMEDYFGYSILFVMNITDVDDKIVLKARRNYLLKQYQQQATDISQVHAFCRVPAWIRFLKKKPGDMLDNMICR